MRRKLHIALLAIASASACLAQEGFRESQQSYMCVREAYREKDLSTDSPELYLVAYKKEKQLERWAKNKDEKKSGLLLSIAICRTSGQPGPKRNYQEEKGRINLWNDMMIAYDVFLQRRQLPVITFLSHGRHQIQ